MNLSNSLTASRLIFAPVFFLVFFLPVWTGAFLQSAVVLLWVIFFVSEFTDIIDGKVARARNEISDLGKLLDPFADVIVRFTYFLCLTVAGVMPSWVIFLIMYRELGIIFLRMMMYRTGTALAARTGGKLKSVLYAIAAGTGLAIVTAQRFGMAEPIHAFLEVFAIVVYVAAVLFAVGSFVDYIVVYRRHIKRNTTP